MPVTREVWFIVGVTVLVSFGVFGCLLSLIILNRIKRNDRNEKYRFLLMCLITNDCVEVIFFLIAYWTVFRLPQDTKSLFLCFCVFVLKFSGLASSCVAVVMAVERWLALTKPFFYKKHITYSLVKRAVILLLLIDLFFCCIPVLEFDSYIKGLKSCAHPRDSIDSFDVAYNYMLYIFGAFLWVTTVYMNINVMKALCMKEELNQSNNVTCVGNTMASARKEEKSYAWLMLSLCFTIVVPSIINLVSFLASQWFKDESMNTLHVISDYTIIVQFTMDPYLYVLQQRKLVKLIFKWPTIRVTDSIENSTSPIAISTNRRAS